jgi:ribose-phosphate pyrophosphokinase
MIDTGHTVKLAAEVLKEAGAKDIYVLICHGEFACFCSKECGADGLMNVFYRTLVGRDNEDTAGSADQEVDRKSVGKYDDGDQMLMEFWLSHQVTNSIDQTARVEATDGKMGTIDIAPLIAESIRRTHNG